MFPFGHGPERKLALHGVGSRVPGGREGRKRFSAYRLQNSEI